MAEKCPKCGSKSVSSTGIGYVEKFVEGIGLVPVAAISKTGKFFNNGQDVFSKVVGSIADAVGGAVADGISKNIATQRKCNRCGHVFHSKPDKGWFK